MKDVAVIFDMDGTMVDNMQVHADAWREFARRHKVNTTDEFFKMFGRTNAELLENLFGKELPDRDIKEYAKAKEAVYRELYAPVIKPVKGLLDLMEELRKMNVKIGVATSAPYENAIFVMDQLNLHPYISALAEESMVEKGKPAPDLYLKACELLDKPPAACLAFEDTPIGVEAAKKAGLTVVGITTSVTAKELSAAQKVIEDFTATSARQVLHMLNNKNQKKNFL
jgi:HAD superfamily hydrolase (TIGR01509 family)